MIDEFVRNLISPAGGYIRTVVAGEDSLLYSIAGGYRYCANVGRHHRSNNVYFLACLRNQKLFQRCYDPDCAGFQSEGVLVPGSWIAQRVERGEMLSDAELAQFIADAPDAIP